MIDDISNRALRYTQQLDSAAATESAALAELATHIEMLVDRPDLLALERQSNKLRFGALYERAPNAMPGEEAWRAPLVAGLIAAEVELRGPLRLSPAQNMLLAIQFETLAGELARCGLPAHAALAWHHAFELHRLTKDFDAQDRCGLALARARRRAAPLGWRRALGMASDLLCGYGYRPFWLLGWVVVQIVVCTALGLLWAGDKTWTEVLYLGGVTFLGPLGPASADGMDPQARVLFAVEAWLGVVSMSVFFALLVRRWFRL
ncbi:hypothetical protein [Nocardia sp. XZ_19_385]|uniref:hypothetical protein n=1 Tax=Nocardia sp. XZ_19_385 TaxID=2769488 RepID=UPI00188E252E|nr:hypothetical protein [Nocardia sp. XZ_19_385]